MIDRNILDKNVEKYLKNIKYFELTLFKNAFVKNALFICVTFIAYIYFKLRGNLPVKDHLK